MLDSLSADARAHTCPHAHKADRSTAAAWIIRLSQEAHGGARLAYATALRDNIEAGEMDASETHPDMHPDRHAPKQTCTLTDRHR